MRKRDRIFAREVTCNSWALRRVSSGLFSGDRSREKPLRAYGRRNPTSTKPVRITHASSSENVGRRASSFGISLEPAVPRGLGEDARSRKSDAFDGASRPTSGNALTVPDAVKLNSSKGVRYRRVSSP